MFSSVTKAGVIIHPDNMSGHLPIFCKFDMDQLNLEVERLTSTPKPSWSTASYEQQVYYRDNIDKRRNTLRLTTGMQPLIHSPLSES